MKGQISLIEAIISAVALLVAFNMIMNAGEYQTKWKEAINSLYGRDILITADRLGKLHDYSFSLAKFNSEFLSLIDAVKDSIKKVEVQGTVKNSIYIACDCTNDQITYLQNILNDMKFNTRTISVTVCSTTLPAINNCGSSSKYPDVLVIWGYKDLASYISTLADFIDNGNGLVELADIPNSKVDGQGVDDDTGQKQIFGLSYVDEGIFPSNQDGFLKPRNSSQLPYQSYKWFYHLPYVLKGISTGSIPTEGDIPSCTLTATAGEFKFQNTNRKFWICGTESVYWDTGGNGIADILVAKRTKFSIGVSNFFLNYIDSNDKIRISFKPDYKFNDFVNPNDETLNKIGIPLQNNKTRVLLSMGFWDLTQERPVAGIIFNGTENAKTVWMADFARGPNGLTNSGDDHKQLLASMVLSLSNKKTKEMFQPTGQITSYINVNNTDVLEIYKVDLSVGTPF